MKENTFIIQEIAGTREGKPKINIMGFSHYGNLKFFYLKTITNYIYDH